jgi:hypothetical protein
MVLSEIAALLRMAALTAVSDDGKAVAETVRARRTASASEGVDSIMRS